MSANTGIRTRIAMVERESIVIKTGRRTGTVEVATEATETGITMTASQRGNQRVMI